MERDCTPLAFDYHLDSRAVLMPEEPVTLLARGSDPPEPPGGRKAP